MGGWSDIFDGIGGIFSFVLDLAFWGYLKGGGGQSPGQAVGTGAGHAAASYLTILLALGMFVTMLVVVFGVPLSAVPVEVIPAP